MGQSRSFLLGRWSGVQRGEIFRTYLETQTMPQEARVYEGSKFWNVFSCLGVPHGALEFSNWKFMSGWLYERPECLDYVHHQAPLVLANRESFLESFVSASCDFVAQFLTVFMPFPWLNTKNLRCSTVWTFITQKQRGLIQHLLFKTCQGTCGACYMFAALDSLSDRHCIDTTKVLRGRGFGRLAGRESVAMDVNTTHHHGLRFMYTRKRWFRCRYHGRNFVS